jgi:hypothetical protein
MGGGDLAGKRSELRLSVSICTEIQNLLKFSLKENHLEKEKGQNRHTIVGKSFRKEL